MEIVCSQDRRRSRHPSPYSLAPVVFPSSAIYAPTKFYALFAILVKGITTAGGTFNHT